MNNFLLYAIILFFITILFGCSSSLSSQVDNAIGDKLDSIGDKELPQLIITQKINYFLFPLFFALFTSIILIVSGVRMIGIGVLLASITCIILIVTMALYMKVIAVVGIGVLLIGIYFLGKNIFDRAITERDLVDSVQTAKIYISPKKKEELGIALQKKQSKHTKSIVKKIKG